MNDENLDNQLKRISKFINDDFKDIVESPFKAGFNEEENVERTDESLMARGMIVGLFQRTNLSDEEIFEIVALGDGKWKEFIPYLRSQYEEGKKIGKEGYRDKG